MIGDVTGGTKLTLDTCIWAGKPYLVNPTADQLRTWLIDHPIRVLNVAGSRGISLPAKQPAQYRKVSMDTLRSPDW